MELTLNSSQQIAMESFKKWLKDYHLKIFTLTGFAGTGKTYLLSEMTKELYKRGIIYKVVAPTGKAATVLRTKGIDATTIHKLIYDVVEHKDGTISFERKDDSFFNEFQIVIVDEATMVNQEVYYELLSIDKRIIFSGDIAQLPPVETDDDINFNVFTENKIDAQLTEIMRQTGDENNIPVIAEQFRFGKNVKVGNYGNVIVMYKSSFTNEKLINLYKRADQILCGRNATKDQINRLLKLNPETIDIEVGDKVMCLTNNDKIFVDSNYEIELCNGLVGKCIDITSMKKTFDLKLGFMKFQADIGDEKITDPIPFSLIDHKTNEMYHGKSDKYYISDAGIYKKYVKKNKDKNDGIETQRINQFDLGYAISVHKSQGSEWNNVIIIDESYCFKDKKYNWLYTAVTRAKKNLIILR